MGAIRRHIGPRDWDEDVRSVGAAEGASAEIWFRTGPGRGSSHDSVGQGVSRPDPAKLDDLESWPPLALSAWRDTCDTLHMWMQMVGKLKLARCAPENHWWHVTFSVSGRGLSSGLIPDGKRAFEAEFDFREHKLRLLSTDAFQH